MEYRKWNYFLKNCWWQGMKLAILNILSSCQHFDDSIIALLRQNCCFMSIYITTMKENQYSMKLNIYRKLGAVEGLHFILSLNFFNQNYLVHFLSFECFLCIAAYLGINYFFQSPSKRPAQRKLYRIPCLRQSFLIMIFNFATFHSGCIINIPTNRMFSLMLLMSYNAKYGNPVIQLPFLA